MINTTAFVVQDTPPSGYWEETRDISSIRPFRYVRFLSPDDGWNNIAELEFYTSA